MVSFGSMVHQLPDNIIKKVLHAFSHLDYDIIFKYGSPLNVVSENIHVVKWMPQNDILANHKLKLFITHGGMNSMMEAIYHKTPMLVFPFGFDQLTTASYVQTQQFGRVMDIATFTEVELMNNIEDIIGSTEYVNNVREAGDIIREMKANNVSNPVFWIEHVIRYGSKYVRSKAYDQSIYQYLMLDVLGIFILFMVVITVAIFLVVNLVLNMYCNQRKVID